MRPVGRRLLARVGTRVARLDRRRTPHWVIVRVIPRAVAMRFDPAAADGLQATLELAIRDPRGRAPARFELAIADESCSVRPGPAKHPGARANVGADDLILLVSGAARWPELLSNGRFELSGDPFLALRFASLFKLPVALEPV
ncbi:MAG: SCP2 sterol-binding domain-containing protein [Solirubrobacteraceae bacterium]